MFPSLQKCLFIHLCIPYTHPRFLSVVKALGSSISDPKSKKLIDERGAHLDKSANVLISVSKACGANDSSLKEMDEVLTQMKEILLQYGVTTELQGISGSDNAVVKNIIYLFLLTREDISSSNRKHSSAHCCAYYFRWKTRAIPNWF